MAETEPYRVLARKYRPQNFAAVIGQEILVKTLTNAIATGRIAHAFLLTGVRGVGKTSTARIIARALNCIGPDGHGGPTIAPCGLCSPCQSIAEDRAIDVLEIDAASRTGVDDIREILDGVRYRPVALRYKIYIIDEVHMLSRNAFNALLKTLEEPPAHTKFIFATTELRKVPVTVLSRCQRFDLRRVPTPALISHFAKIAGLEVIAIEDEALRLIARAADGSVRDGLSLLDQAIVLAEPGADKPMITAAMIEAMLGLGDAARIIDLFEAVLDGKINVALDIAAELYSAGAEGLVIAQDMLALCHETCRLQALGAASAKPPDAPVEPRLVQLAARASIPILTRIWQILLKGIAEIQQSGSSRAAFEMVLIRLAYVADVPTPAELAKMIAGAPEDDINPTPRLKIVEMLPELAPRPTSENARIAPSRTRHGDANGATARVLETEPPPNILEAEASSDPPAYDDPTSFSDLVELCGAKREARLRAHLTHDVHLVHFEPGRLEFRQGERAPSNLAAQLTQCLAEWTGKRWIISITGAKGSPSLAESAAAEDAMQRQWVEAQPMIQTALQLFPGAQIERINIQRPVAVAVAVDGESGALIAAIDSDTLLATDYDNIADGMVEEPYLSGEETQ